MQFEGHSTAVADIVVDAVGKYAYTIGSPHAEELPVIMDVALEERTKASPALEHHDTCTRLWQQSPILTQVALAENNQSGLSLFGFLQVLTVHSNVRIENHTSHALQVRFPRRFRFCDHISVLKLR